MNRTIHAAIFDRGELERLRARVGRLFVALQEASEMAAGEAGAAWLPAVDVCESEASVTVMVELPGVRAEQIKVGLTSTRLRICGEKKRAVPRSRVVTHLCSERSYGNFSRVVPLRWTINVNAATAELKDGILIVQLPKQKDRRGAEFKVSVRDTEE